MQTPQDQPQTDDSSFTHLQRGKACLPCRKRKMRCDGERPTCSQCQRRQEDCEYTDGPGPTASQILEQQISRLEARIQELEGSASQIEPDSHISDRFEQPWMGNNQPPNETVEFLLKVFLPLASDLGFFLNMERLFSSASSPRIEHWQKISTPVLRNVVYLWGVHISQDEHLITYQSRLLHRTIQSVHSSLADVNRNTVHILQAEILLSHYFYHNGRQFEGRFHSNAAVSLAISSHMHKIGKDNSQPDPFVTLIVQDSSLPPPVDIIEEGERIRAWWVTYILDKTWTATVGMPSAITDDVFHGTQIDTPWPLDMMAYEQQTSLLNYSSDATVYNFLEALRSGNLDIDRSILSLYAKAATLYERADRIALQDRQSTHSGQPAESLDSVRAWIATFQRILPPLDRSVSDENIRGIFIVYALSHCAIIRLYASSMQRDPGAQIRCLTAANAIVSALQAIDHHRLGLVAPIIGVIFTTTAEVLQRGIATLNSTRQAWASSSAMPGEDDLRASLTEVLAALAHYASTSAFFQQQLSVLRETQV